jgi:hypothetical protein
MFFAKQQAIQQKPFERHSAKQKSDQFNKQMFASNLPKCNYG